MKNAGGTAQESPDLTRIVGHELRAPLAGILETADLILYGIEGDISQTIREDVQEIRDSAEQTLEVIDKILELLRVENVRAEDAMFNLSVVVDQVRDGLQPLVLKLKLPDPLPLVRANPDGVRQLLCLLIHNIVRSGSHRRVTLSAHVEGNFVIVSIQEGQRVRSHKRLSIEELLSLKRREGLSSLDLLLCKRLIECQGGTIWITCGKDMQNLTWDVSLPAVHDYPAISETVGN